jgi:hypothetical protein
MNNADLPAMPTDQFGTGAEGGISKREYFAAHLSVDSDAITFNSKEGIELFIGRSVDTDNPIDLAASQFEALAIARLMAVDAILAKMEKAPTQ